MPAQTNPVVPFQKGQQVFNKANPSERGYYTGNYQEIPGITLVEIQFNDGSKKSLALNAVEVIDLASTSSLKEQLKAEYFGGKTDLRRLITYEKLKGTLHEVIYSMEAAQIDFYPYQFKPVLKFINSPTERLVLADEVGLGKTIESGLIWMEMQARHQSSRLLVVCPKILAEKWKDELKTKFLLDARIVDFNAFRDEIDELKKNGPQHPFVLIGTYTGLRPPKEERNNLKRPPEDTPSKSKKAQLLRELRHWPEDHYPFDMVIFDEAHYMRNQATTTFHLGECLSSNARSVLCVSATPVNNTNIDLHSLLRLIDEEFFATQSVFDELIDVNRPTVQLGNALTQSTIDETVITHAVSEMAKSQYINRSPLFEKLLEVLSHLSESAYKDKKQLALCQDMAEKLNLLGNYVNRTRRLQVQENRPIRTPIVLSIEYTSQEEALYKAILKLVRLKCRLNNQPFHVFQVMTLQLMAASCLPMLADRILHEDLNADDNLLQEAMGTELPEKNQQAISRDDILGLRHLVNYDFKKHDSKFNKLLELIHGKLRDEKIIIFSFYRSTLAYLRDRLSSAGERVTSIHGGIKTEDRWKEIDRFKDPAGPRILLASEVGSEGIDLQFCRVVVNYDLPWNPMRVEQRIGRIDRVGQKANQLSIVNFKIQGTIEERLFEKLYQKLDQFSNSLGDLDAVIGEEIKKLTIDLLSNDLTPQQEAAKIDQAGQVIENQAVTIQNLINNAPALVALSDYVQKKVEEDRNKGRYLQAKELESYLVDFFDRNFKGTEIGYNDPKPNCFRLRLSEEARMSLLGFISNDRTISARPLRHKEIKFSFDREVIKRLPSALRSSVHFINHLSPLIRWMTKVNQDRDHEFHKLSALKLKAGPLPVGEYLYRIERWKMQGLSNFEKLAYGIIPIQNGNPLSEDNAELIFQKILMESENWSYRSYDANLMLEKYDQLKSEMSKWFAEALSQFKAENDSSYQIKTTRVENIYSRRIQAHEDRLTTLIQRGREERYIKGAETRLRNTQETMASILQKLKGKSILLPERGGIATGIISVE
jgi:SNF2 family DNA or RNA helicase